ncbi:dihydrodipicolinate synthase family protein [Halocatena pleomorpha]|uniref:Dihydrodipicolinate synthase family protein n=1 Tax=Halocatena pleomorpha TaxID=1785090 RepID=A0A3P3RG14_9EURY|nr:dihydrodipicolinate synthase family protein [Halocatena pleomorpha]RRJ32466.1 dihydrodipicolinate synthase family protein [Halocatena pleomorpha]
MSAHAPAPGADDPLALQGVIPPTITAFTEDESVDPKTTAAHARFVVDRGVHGVFPLGTNGEFTLLTPDERTRVIEAVVTEIDGEVPVIAGVGAPSTHETIDHAKQAANVGVDGLVVVTPYYYPIDDEGAVEHYRRVAQSTSLPVYVYHIPSKTGNALSRETLIEIAELDGIAGIKDSSKDVPLLGQVVADAPNASFFAGSDSLLVPGLNLGCCGLVSAVANAFPELVVELYDAYDDGDEERAQALQETVFEVRRAFKQGPYLAGVKSALSLRGFDSGPLRSPLRRMSDAEETTLAEELERLELLSR